MGASDRILRGFIPKEEVADATTWEFSSLTGGAVRKSSTEHLLSERERRAFEKGRAQGRAEGLQQAALQKAGYAQQLDQVLRALRARFVELESGGADATLEMALAIARHVVRREVQVQRDAVLPVLREALAALIDQQSHPRVLLNPQDLALLQGELDQQGSFKHCHFVPDASVARGGCRVETPKGEIDARLGTRWQCVLDALGLPQSGADIEDPQPEDPHP